MLGTGTIETGHSNSAERFLPPNKIGKKIPSNKCSKKNFDGLYEVLVPGSDLEEVSPPTSAIKEPSKQPV